MLLHLSMKLLYFYNNKNDKIYKLINYSINKIFNNKIIIFNIS